MIDLSLWLASNYKFNNISSYFYDKFPISSIAIGLIDYTANVSSSNDLINAKIILRSTCSGESSNFEEDDHGLFSSSLLVAQGQQIFRGLIPNANLFFYGFKPNDAITEVELVSAINWLIEQQVQLICLPFGADTEVSAVTEVINKAVNLGILIFAAVGNDYPKPSLFPSCLGNVLSVGALDQHYLSLDDCCRNPEPDCWLPGLKIPGLTGSGELAYRSGTSVACVLATGFAAHYLVKTKQKSIKKNDFINYIKELGVMRK
ncbi:S8/S53 family peptidase [uncultured Thiothrix sp.]|uniref:S8/S53 family peptidase n=1 Tax=uncultured Thiothrix sp. TaxID=223185 RepID=UPI0026273A0A|nr:S8/S53 family peptidase [uncultured Thiothrix sp.]HMT94826.1 S8/S53 family peptidase [Thiolinea sp.]